MENLRLLFEKANIKYIVSVDDCYNTNIQLEKYSIMEFFNANLGIAILFCNEIGITHFEETLKSLDEDYEDFVESIVEGLTPEQVEIFVDKYYTTNSVEKNALENFCENLVESGIIDTYRKTPSIQEAKDLYDNIQETFEINPEKRLLWMIDKDFQKSNGSANDGLELISLLIAGKRENHIFALTSAQMGEVDNESFRERLTNDPSEKLLACVIHKHKIINEAYNELYEQMYFGFRENYSGSIIEHLNKNMTNAANTAGEVIKTIGEDAIHRVFLLGSKSEGVSPIETFQRLMMVILKNDISIKLCDNYDSISKLIHDYAGLCSWCAIKKENEGDFKKIEDIRRSEYYDLNVNRMFAPVAYGDVFLINEIPYLLLTQSCNVVLRNDGTRKALSATLVKIIPETDKDKDSHYVIEYYESQQKRSIAYNHIINVEFNVLDLCCLNNDGGLYVLDDYHIENFNYRYSDGVFIALKKTISQNKSLIIDFKTIQEEKNTISIDDLISKVRKMYNGNTTELSASFDSGIKYNGKRVCRLNQNIVDDISKRYSEYHSRKGLDFDFTKQYKIHEYQIKYNLDFSFIGVDIADASRVLPSKYKYFITEEFDKSSVKAAFEIYYRNEVLKTQKNINVGKVETSNSLILVSSQHIPVRIHENIMFEVLDFSNNILTIKIPKGLLSDRFNGKTKNSTYDSPNSNNKIKISNDHVSFQFEVGQALICDVLEVFKEQIEFKFHVEENIILSF